MVNGALGVYGDCIMNDKRRKKKVREGEKNKEEMRDSSWKDSVQ